MIMAPVETFGVVLVHDRETWILVLSNCLGLVLLVMKLHDNIKEEQFTVFS